MANVQTRVTMNTCMVCGLSTFDCSVDDGPGDWLGKVVLLWDPDDELGALCPSLSHAHLYEPILPTTCEARLENCRPRTEASPIEVCAATPTVSPGGYVQLPEETNVFCRVFFRYRVNNQPPSDNKRHYLPVHEVCWKMAESLWKTSPGTAYIQDLRSMFLALGWRYTIGIKCFDRHDFEFPPNFRMGNDYRMRWAAWRMKWERKEQFVPSGALPGYSENPMDNIKDLWLTDPTGRFATSDLLLNLQHTPCRKPTKFDGLFLGLPPEIRASIVNHVTFRDLPLITSGTLPQSFWLRQLKLGRALPWLWELESEILEAKAVETCPGGDAFEWNWELLVRQLSRGVDFGVKADVPAGTNPYAPMTKGGKVIRSDETFWETTGYYNDLVHVPPGLFNRRRIWQLLEEMFVGDYIPLADPDIHVGYHRLRPKFVVKECIQLPWDKSGRLLKTPKWIPSFDFEAYVRRVGGEVYIRSDVIRPMQYWQDPGGYWKRSSHVAKESFRLMGPKGTPTEHVWRILRRLDYPV